MDLIVLAFFLSYLLISLLAFALLSNNSIKFIMSYVFFKHCFFFLTLWNIVKYKVDNSIILLYISNILSITRTYRIAAHLLHKYMNSN